MKERKKSQWNMFLVISKAVEMACSKLSLQVCISPSLSLTFLYFFSVEMLFWALRHCRFRLYNKNLALLSFLSTRFLSLCIYYLALNCKSITSLYNIFVFLDFSRFFHLLFRLKKKLFYCFEFRNRKRFFFVWFFFFFLVLILFFFVWIIVRFCLVSRD